MAGFVPDKEDKRTRVQKYNSTRIQNFNITIVYK